MCAKKSKSIHLWTFIAAVHSLFWPVFVHAQYKDSTMNVRTDFIIDKLEFIAQSRDVPIDYTDVIDDYLYYLDHPINLNSEERASLPGLYLINELQLNNLNHYIHETGALLSIYELKTIPGFDQKSVELLLPFICVKEASHPHKWVFKEIIGYGKHQLLLRYGQQIETSKAYRMQDAALLHPGTTYLGNPQQWSMRYSFNFRNNIRLGFTAEKDAGEPWPGARLNDSIHAALGKQLPSNVDFLSAYAYMADAGFLKKLIIGDYHLEFGQGLTLWTGVSFGKSSESVKLDKYGQGIRPNSSVNENHFFRGAAFTLGWKGFALTSFYSKNKVDGNQIISEEGHVVGLSSLQETGMHRSINELLDKDVLFVTNFGGRLAFSHRMLETGITVYNTALSKNLIAASTLYQMYRFSGLTTTNMGLDLRYNMNKVSLFGEASRSSNDAYAFLIGINTFLNERLKLSILYHNYGRAYQNLFAMPFAESSAVSNERGFYMGFKALLHKNWQLSAYADHFIFPWLTYRADAPSIGKDYLVQLNFTPSERAEVYFRTRAKLHQGNHSADFDYLPQIMNTLRTEFRLFLMVQAAPSIILKNRIEYVKVQPEFGKVQNGYLMYQDILFRPERFPLEASFRYALFDTDSYDSRIYAYENDVLYAFSIPSFFDKGQKVYLMLRWKALKWMDLWLRVARTTWFHRTSIGSGADEIDGNHKTEVKVQLKLKL